MPRSRLSPTHQEVKTLNDVRHGHRRGEPSPYLLRMRYLKGGAYLGGRAGQQERMGLVEENGGTYENFTKEKTISRWALPFNLANSGDSETSAETSGAALETYIWVVQVLRKRPTIVYPGCEEIKGSCKKTWRSRRKKLCHKLTCAQWKRWCTVGPEDA